MAPKLSPDTHERHPISTHSSPKQPQHAGLGCGKLFGAGIPFETVDVEATPFGEHVSNAGQKWSVGPLVLSWCLNCHKG
jgi:hypothetical protein